MYCTRKYVLLEKLLVLVNILIKCKTMPAIELPFYYNLEF